MNLVKREGFISLKRELFDKYYGHLNQMQRSAVYSVNGPLLILAGAGSGKTTVLVNRIANIIRYGNAYNSEAIPKEADALYERMTELADRGTREEIGEFLTCFAETPANPYKILCITFTNKAASEF